jgi:hypothetical protein
LADSSNRKDIQVRQFDWILSAWPSFGTDHLLDRWSPQQLGLCFYVGEDDTWHLGSCCFRYPSSHSEQFEDWLFDSRCRSERVKKLSGLTHMSAPGFYRGFPSALVEELGLIGNRRLRLWDVETLEGLVSTMSLKKGDSLKTQDEMFSRMLGNIHLGSCYPLKTRPGELRPEI